MKKKKVLFEIRSYFNENEILYMLSEGTIWKKDGSYFLEWDGSDKLGEFGDKVLIEVKDENKLVFSSGKKSSGQYIMLEDGKRYVAQHFDHSPFFYAPVGVSVDSIKNSLKGNSGELEFSYTTDTYNSKNIKKTFDIKIKENEA